MITYTGSTQEAQVGNKPLIETFLQNLVITLTLG
jgi:hypothetical protein